MIWRHALNLPVFFIERNIVCDLVVSMKSPWNTNLNGNVVIEETFLTQILGQ